LEGFTDDRALVVPQEVVMVNPLLYLGAVVPLLFESDGLVVYLVGGEAGVVESRCSETVRRQCR